MDGSPEADASSCRVPPNCTLQVDDVEQEWTLKPNTSDFIYSRNPNQAISDWSKLMGECRGEGWS
jgi:hypothetical protein